MLCREMALFDTLQVSVTSAFDRRLSLHPRNTSPRLTANGDKRSFASPLPDLDCRTPGRTSLRAGCRNLEELEKTGSCSPIADCRRENAPEPRTKWRAGTLSPQDPSGESPHRSARPKSSTRADIPIFLAQNNHLKQSYVPRRIPNADTRRIFDPRSVLRPLCAGEIESRCSLRRAPGGIDGPPTPGA